MSNEVQLRDIEPSDLPIFYEHQLDAQFAGARGYIDAIVYPEETRDVLALALRAAMHNRGPHLGPFVLPESV